MHIKKTRENKTSKVDDNEEQHKGEQWKTK